jgi:abhydrolase domain-containing protein 6
MKKKRLKKVSIGLALTVYTITLAFWVVSGVKTASVLANNDHVITMYANTIDLGDDRTMFYREVGEEHEETILFIHGFLGSSYDFVHVMDALKDRYHVIAVDLIGFGLSSKPLSYDYGKANQAETVYNFIQEKNVSNLTVMAHSMGGEVTIHLVSSYPAFFKNLILIGSAGYVEEGSSSTPPTLPLFVYKEIVQNYFIQRAFFLTAYSEFERQNKLITFEDFDEMYIVNRTIPPEILRKFSADNDTMNMTNKINTITIPVLLMWGEFDGFIPLSVGEKLQESFGENATLLVMPNAGHLPFDTFFDDFMRYVEEFMA